jgi:nicotinamidase-related amidase
VFDFVKPLLDRHEHCSSGIMAKTRSATALLLVDVINDLDFPGSGALVKAAEAMADRLARLAQRARKAGVPVIYVNDNFGRWRSDWRTVVARCGAEDAPGHRVARRLQPTEHDYFVLKPKHSGFFSTPLEILLRYLGVDTVILTGIATDICILLTANDAYMRDYRIVVPRDCVAANTRAKSEFALREIRDVLKGSTPAGASIRFGPAARRPSRRGKRPRAASRVVGSRRLA